MSETMTSLQRVLTTLGHKEPDRVPFFLLHTMHGAKELGMSIKDYYSKAKNVVEGQLRLHKKYRSDCLYLFFYAAQEIEAWGGEIVYIEDGPPNSGTPFISDIEDIIKLEPPKICESPSLVRQLEAISVLKEKVADTVPIIGVAMSPFSLPVMQMGFDKYFDIMFERPELFLKLMDVNKEFCVSWANAQAEAGATAICYFDPVSSQTIIDRELYLKTGFNIACETIKRIKVPTATHFASGRSLGILGDVAKTGTAVVGVSSLEDLAKIKKACKNKLTVLGNLNGIEMRRWTQSEAEQHVKEAISKAGSGGGFILSDNHGEIPWQVKDETLMAISDAVHKWGRYPLKSEN